MLYTKFVLYFKDFYPFDKVYVNDVETPIWIYSEHEELGILKIITEYNRETRFVLKTRDGSSYYSVKVVLQDYKHKVNIFLEKGDLVYRID
jgi:hypothetical protein